MRFPVARIDPTELQEARIGSLQYTHQKLAVHGRGAQAPRNRHCRFADAQRASQNVTEALEVVSNQVRAVRSRGEGRPEGAPRRRRVGK
jgi:hypothetical protein